MTRGVQRRRRRRSAFTLIEVMVSLGVMTVGAMAILALQTHTIRSNSHARELTTAMQIAQIWAERLKQDAATWNEAAAASGTPSVSTVLANTTYLRTISSPPAFATLTNLTAPISNAFDRDGNDVTPGTHFYCASVRLGWVYFGRAMRADVRVWWAREDKQITVDFPACQDTDAPLNPGGTQFDNYHVVYLPTVIRMVTVDR
jgi:type IV pilus assembly protein PilV